MFVQKKIRNIRGANPAEVAKKVALKLLVKNIYNMYFSIIEIKTNKIIHYQSNKIELVRPYHKNGKLIKYRIIVKKMRKQVGGTYQPNLEDENDPIFQFFSREQFDISFEETQHFGRIIRRIIHIKDLSKNNCLQIIFKSSNSSENDYIELFKLDRCHFQGSANLETLIEYAKHLKNILKIKLNVIFLEDASIIPDTKIWLWLLSILTTGESWYNRFGFINEDYQKEKEHNRKIIQMNIMDFIRDCKSKTKYHINESRNQKITLFFEKYKSKSVKDVFIEIKNQLKEKRISIEDSRAIDIMLQIIQFSDVINYNPFIYYTIPEINS